MLCLAKDGWAIKIDGKDFLDCTSYDKVGQGLERMSVEHLAGHVGLLSWQDRMLRNQFTSLAWETLERDHFNTADWITSSFLRRLDQNHTTSDVDKRVFTKSQSIQLGKTKRRAYAVTMF